MKEQIYRNKIINTQLEGITDSLKRSEQTKAFDSNSFNLSTEVEQTHGTIPVLTSGMDKVKPTAEKANHGNIKPELITLLKQFLERRHLPQLIENVIPDKRNQELITYSKESIIKAALAIFLFREGSGNKFDDDCHDADEKYSRTNMAQFIDAPEKCVPVIKTIETFMKDLDRE